MGDATKRESFDGLRRLGIAALVLCGLMAVGLIALHVAVGRREAAVRRQWREVELRSDGETPARTLAPSASAPASEAGPVQPRARLADVQAGTHGATDADALGPAGAPPDAVPLDGAEGPATGDVDVQALFETAEGYQPWRAFLKAVEQSTRDEDAPLPRDLAARLEPLAGDLHGHAASAPAA